MFKWSKRLIWLKRVCFLFVEVLIAETDSIWDMPEPTTELISSLVEASESHEAFDLIPRPPVADFMFRRLVVLSSWGFLELSGLRKSSIISNETSLYKNDDCAWENDELGDD
ncbi:hypothetical protein BpHYR1_050839 [Brachionus plicatilis]|uniref:Uncharacterized protein n=1 Tax=Brachionus plicatilis TaxID=10195 RepID=A0A3M7PA21_BRAPC|nr:hypothetical protein BpHYR1_050839 [Brachionus plicatilis]